MKEIESSEQWKTDLNPTMKLIITLNWYCNTTSGAKGISIRKNEKSSGNNTYDSNAVVSFFLKKIIWCRHWLVVAIWNWWLQASVQNRLPRKLKIAVSVFPQIFSKRDQMIKIERRQSRGKPGKLWQTFLGPVNSPWRQRCKHIWQLVK